MRYLAQFLQIVYSKTGDTGLLRAWAQGFLQSGWVQQRPLWVLIPVRIPGRISGRISGRNEAEGLGRRTPSRADLQRLGYDGHPHRDRPVFGRNWSS